MGALIYKAVSIYHSDMLPQALKSHPLFLVAYQKCQYRRENQNVLQILPPKKQCLMIMPI